jgi:hypothetical protein
MRGPTRLIAHPSRRVVDDQARLKVRIAASLTASTDFLDELMDARQFRSRLLHLGLRRWGRHGRSARSTRTQCHFARGRRRQRVLCYQTRPRREPRSCSVLRPALHRQRSDKQYHVYLSVSYTTTEPHTNLTRKPSQELERLWIIVR